MRPQSGSQGRTRKGAAPATLLLLLVPVLVIFFVVVALFVGVVILFVIIPSSAFVFPFCVREAYSRGDAYGKESQPQSLKMILFLLHDLNLTMRYCEVKFPVHQRHGA